jgi:hypothetical protein
MLQTAACPRQTLPIDYAARPVLLLPFQRLVSCSRALDVEARFNLARLHVIHLKLLQDRLGGALNARVRRLHLRAATRNERLSPVERARP